MFLRSIASYRKLMGAQCLQLNSLQQINYSRSVEVNYSIVDKDKILNVLNEATPESLMRYQIAKARIKKLTQWKKKNGCIQSLTDIENVEGFDEKLLTKFYNSILDGGCDEKEVNCNSKIKGQILNPNLTKEVRQKCKSVLAVYITVNCVCWMMIDRRTYEVVQWTYYDIDYKDEKKSQLSEIMDIGWRVYQQLPLADVYVMKAEATTLRGAGSDPNNPKLVTVNMQKVQLVAVIVALLNARGHSVDSANGENSTISPLEQKVYFMRSTLPYRLYGTLVGNERVSTDQRIEMILRETETETPNNQYGPHVKIPADLINMYRSRKELEKDMLGHCMLLALTFMDVCIYKNVEKTNSLLNNNGR